MCLGPHHQLLIGNRRITEPDKARVRVRGKARDRVAEWAREVAWDVAAVAEVRVEAKAVVARAVAGAELDS